MSALSRREFFLGSADKFFSKKNLKNSIEIKKIEKPEVVIGKVYDFPIGKKKLFQDLDIEIESFAEGLRARAIDTTQEVNKQIFYAIKQIFYAIKSNHLGELIVNRSEVWPAELVFSILKFEPETFDSTAVEPKSFDLKQEDRK